MSMHIACSGFTSDQRMQKLSIEKNLETLKKTHRSYTSDWIREGSLNNLRDVHQFYCPRSKPIEKDSREIFVKGDLKEVSDNFQSLMLYCANDVFATFEVYRTLFEVFVERFPHPVTLSGMLEMSTMYLPTNHNWLKYQSNCRNSFNDTQNILKNVLQKSADEGCEFVDFKDNDPWLFNLEWDRKLAKKQKKKVQPIEEKFNYFRDEFEFPDFKNSFLKIASDKNRLENTKNDYLNVCEDIQRAFNTIALMHKSIPHLVNYPNWYRELCQKPSDKNWMPGPSLTTTRVRSTPALLRLSWHGFPLHYNKSKGWSYIINQKTIETKRKNIENDSSNLNEKSVNYKLNKKKTESKRLSVENNLLNDENYILVKIPHKDGDKMNVGNPLSKSFLSKIEENVLSSYPKRSAELALNLYSNISYWVNNENRINAQKSIWINRNQRRKSLQGVILPMTIVSGTITRRAVESTWLTASSSQKKNRIGGELKSMIQAPRGYRFVGADVDSQELWIASLFGDSHFAKIHGCTAISWMNLQGKKSDGTDIHSKTASMIGINRDQAKIFNYGRIYGAGKKFAEKLLLQFDPDLQEQEASSKAKIMFDNTKGNRVKDKKGNVKWEGGTESEMFNKLEDIAKQKRPQTPVLGSSITKTLEPTLVGDGD